MSTKQTDQPEVSVKDLAEKIGIEPKELRKWLRSQGLGAGGHGKRYAFTPQRAGQLVKKFEASQKVEADES